MAKLPAANQSVLAALLAHLGKVAVAQKNVQGVAAKWSSVLLRPSDEDIEKSFGSAAARAQAVSNLITKSYIKIIMNK